MDTNTICSQKIPQITAVELRDWLQQGKRLILLDVRESWEHVLSHIDDSEHIPLGILSDAFLSFSPEDTVVIYCRSGVRSLYAAEILQKRGYQKVFNLQGGILAWAAAANL